MSFEKRYNSLNEKQKEAVDTIFGPVLVLAGPGSGKTELLAVRIANILSKTDAIPSNILCLTYTENAAINMRDRLRKIIGQDAYKVAIHTFHSFGSEILNRYKYKIQDSSELTPIDEISSSQIFHSIIEKLEWNDPWKSSSQLFQLKNAIAKLKEAGISPIDFEAILKINEQILIDIGPIIENSFEKIQSLGRKKEDLAQKQLLFENLFNELSERLSGIPTHYKLQQNISVSILQSIQNALESGNSKDITAWRNTWLEKGDQDRLVLKDYQKLKKSFSLLKIYQQYQQALQQNAFIDFSDMIIKAGKIIEDDSVVQANIAEQYQWILIDEYQDTNKAQLQLITNIIQNTEAPNIFAVGDDDQSIYKFQGANTENLTLFKNLFEGTKLIILNKNYRSYKEIIDFSRSIISDGDKIGQLFPGQQKAFDAERGNGGQVYKYEFESELEEISWITEDIKQTIAKEKDNPHFKLSDIAVIARKNSTLELIGKALMSQNIPIELSKDENIFGNEIIVLITNILLYIHSLKHATDRDDLLVSILSHPMWNIHRLDIWEISRKIYQAKKDENKVWIEVLRQSTNPQIAKIAHFFMEMTIQSEYKRLEDIIDIITGINAVDLPEEYNDENNCREQLILTINNEEVSFQSPLYEYYFNEKNLKNNPTLYAHHLANVRKIIESIRSFKNQQPKLTIDSFVEYIELIQEYDVTLSASTLIQGSDAVQCITGHKSKGLEYEYVYAVGLTKQNYIKSSFGGSPFLSNMQLEPEKDNLEDVERLIYTIFTRAKNELTLTFSHKNIAEKSTEIVPVLAHIQDFQKIEQKNIDNCTKILELIHTPIESIAPIDDKEQSFLKKLIQSNLSISVTALQNFLNVVEGGPEYFLSKNILHFPQAKSPSASYGTAIHKGLEDLFKYYKIHKTFQKTILVESFEKSLISEGLTEAVEKNLLERGRENLEKLFAEITKKSFHEIHLEFRFHGENGGTFLEDIKLSGAIDRIESTQDDTLIITDYKTGAGFDNLNITSSGSYENIKKWKYDLQLIFYALLFEISPRWRAWKKHRFELLFVEADKKNGKFYSVEKFVQKDEIERLKKLIIAVSKHIQELNFPDISEYSKDVAGIRQFEEDLINGII